MIGAAQVAKMKPDAVIANVGRGEVIDEAALYAALAGWRIRGGIIDVWYSYPSKDDPNPWPSRFPFQKLGNVILSPHNRSEEHTSELQSLMRISYAVFCLKKKKNSKQ